MIPQDGYPQKNNKHWWWCRNSSYTAAAKSLQSCPTLWDPIDLGSPPGSPVLQARTLEWVAISFSNAWKWKVKVKSLSCVRPLAWTAAYQAPPSMGFSRQENWSGLPLPSPWLRLGFSNTFPEKLIYFWQVTMSPKILQQQEPRDLMSIRSV